MKRQIKAMLVFSMLLIFMISVSASSSNPVNAPRIHIKDGTSANWAGYAVQTSLTNPQKNAVSNVQGSWIVPAADCSATPSAYAAFWVGIDGYSSSTVEQIGTDSDCSSGTPRYYAWYEMYPKFPFNLNMAIHPGDLMNAQVTFLGKGKFKLTIKDATTGASFSTTQTSMNAQRSSAEWIAEAPSSSSQVLPLADFNSVNFQGSSATLNGIPGPISSFANDAINMTDFYGNLKAKTSSLGNNGASFSVAWVHS